MVTANNCFWRLEMSLFLIPNCWRVGCCCGSASVCICVCACVCALFVGVLVRANTHPGTCVAVLLFLPLCLFFPLPPTPPSPPTPLLYFPLAENIGGQKKKKNPGGCWDSGWAALPASGAGTGSYGCLLSYSFYSTAPLSQAIHPPSSGPSDSIRSRVMIDDVYFGSNILKPPNWFSSEKEKGASGNSVTQATLKLFWSFVDMGTKWQHEVCLPVDE